MDCPVCKNAMITLELNEVEIDFCTNCSGIWLDAGELELLLGEPQKAKDLINSFKIDKNCKEKARKCPICLKKMRKIIVGRQTPPLLIDKCRKDHGLWFDKGELQNIICKANLDPENKIRQLLTDMFAQDSKQNLESEKT